MSYADWAENLARTLLEDQIPRRWAHVQGVASQARGLAGMLGTEADLVEAGAWLHDIGYSPEVEVTGFHPLDGARYLRDVEKADETLCSLVAYHTGAIIEAQERGVAAELCAEFGTAPEHLASALTFCDITTSPDGMVVRAADRLAEIHSRYGPSHLVSRSIRRATPAILDAVTSTTLRRELVPA
jgi:hypothetical protein